MDASELDQLHRDGRFSTIEVQDDRVTFYYAPAHRRGYLFGTIAFSLLGVSFARPLLSIEHISGLLFLVPAVLVAALAAYKCVIGFIRLKHVPFLIVADVGIGVHGDAKTRVINSRQVHSVEVCENHRRQQGDLALWQTFLVMDGTGERILIHQRVKWNLNAEKELAERLASRWRVRCKAPDA